MILIWLQLLCYTHTHTRDLHVVHIISRPHTASMNRTKKTVMHHQKCGVSSDYVIGLWMSRHLNDFLHNVPCIHGWMVLQSSRRCDRETAVLVGTSLNLIQLWVSHFNRKCLCGVRPDLSSRIVWNAWKRLKCLTDQLNVGHRRRALSPPKCCVKYSEYTWLLL